MDASVLTIGLLAKNKPEVIEDLNNGQGTFHYNHNIKEVSVINNDMGGFEVVANNDPKANGTMYQYDSVRVEYPKTADNIFGTLLTAKYPAKTESKLVNEYQVPNSVLCQRTQSCLMRIFCVTAWLSVKWWMLIVKPIKSRWIYERVCRRFYRG